MLSTSSRAWVSLVMFLVQFLAPLGVTMAAYILISYHLWGAGHIGAATQQQQLRRLASRRRTIKMLVLVVILFGVSWLPLNLYHLISDWSRYELVLTVGLVILNHSQGQFRVSALLCHILH